MNGEEKTAVLSQALARKANAAAGGENVEEASWLTEQAGQLLRHLEGLGCTIARIDPGDPE